MNGDGALQRRQVWVGEGALDGPKLVAVVVGRERSERSVGIEEEQVAVLRPDLPSVELEPGP